MDDTNTYVKTDANSTAPSKQIDRRSWLEFKDAGLLWFVNMILHVFGWAIVIVCDEGKVKEVYPARVKFRGFTESSMERGYRLVSEYVKANADSLVEEASSNE